MITIVLVQFLHLMEEIICKISWIQFILEISTVQTISVVGYSKQTMKYHVILFVSIVGFFTVSTISSAASVSSAEIIVSDREWSNFKVNNDFQAIIISNYCQITISIFTIGIMMTKRISDVVKFIRKQRKQFMNINGNMMLVKWLI